MFKISEKFHALFHVPWTKTVGVSVHEGMLHLVCFERETALWRMKETLHIPLRWEETDASFWCETAAVLHVALAKRGWEKSRIALCLSENQVFSYTKEFPRLSVKEMKKAARWDMLASLPASEAETAYCMDFVPIAEGELLLAALPREKAQKLHQAFLEAGLCLASLCFLPPAVLQTAGVAVADVPFLGADLLQDEDFAAFAAAAGLLMPQKKCAELLPARLRPDLWAVGRIAALFAALFFPCMVLIYGWNIWRIHELQEEERQIAQAMVLLSPERQRMERELQEGGRIAEKERQLLSLAKGAVPCRSLLVHFGTRTVEGAWIRELRVVDGHVIEIEGAATSYDALANFVRSLETDRSFFTAAPLLKRSELRKEAAGKPLVYFSLELKI